MQVGCSHPIIINPPEDVSLKVIDQTTLIVASIYKQKAGQVAANIISHRSAKKDPYKQKGIFIEGAVLRKKEGKKVK